ncbi:MAG TPA: hypothetical protein VM639_07060 [Dongiaceae bacterium]|nr:hypothetical protein [Dongiaceae bacterium]
MAYPETIAPDGGADTAATRRRPRIHQRIHRRDDRPLRPTDWLIMAAFALAVLGSLAYASLKPRHLAGETLGVLAIGGSHDAALAAVVAAGGLVLRDGELTGSVVARAPDDGFVDRLRRAGANLIYRIDRSVNCAGAR